MLNQGQEPVKSGWVRLVALAVALLFAFWVMPPLLPLLTEEAHAQSAPPGPDWSCSLDNIGATLTRCIAAPDPGTKRYITSIVTQSTTTTSGQWILRTGTGTNCGTGTVSLFPSAATVARIASPANTAAPTVISFRTPVIVPSGKDLCLLGVATNTTTAQINGYLGF